MSPMGGGGGWYAPYAPGAVLFSGGSTASVAACTALCVPTLLLTSLLCLARAVGSGERGCSPGGTSTSLASCSGPHTLALFPHLPLLTLPIVLIQCPCPLVGFGLGSIRVEDVVQD